MTSRWLSLWDNQNRSVGQVHSLVLRPLLVTEFRQNYNHPETYSVQVDRPADLLILAEALQDRLCCVYDDATAANVSIVAG
jgi:hypothetical protein